MIINFLKAREILDSRGVPTVEVSLDTEKGSFVSAVPSGSSVGSHEAKELRDGGDRYMGKGVTKAVKNINETIAPAIKGEEVDPEKIDDILLKLDGTKDKSRLGANAILGVSMALFRAAAKEAEKPLYRYISSQFSFKEKMPKPCFNVINGGAHAGGGLDFQELMIVPQKDSFSNNLQIAVESYYQLKVSLEEKYGKSASNIGDEGGFAPKISEPREAISCLAWLGNDLKFFIDVAASEFFDGEKYYIAGRRKTKEEMIGIYKELTEEFDIIGLEDPLEENDFDGWSDLRESLGDTVIIGDDLLVTNIERMEKAFQKKSCNAVIIKINQIGSVTEAISAARKAKEYGWKIIVSHRSGETNDDFIADFAVGIGAEYIKSGAPVRGERIAKYNRLSKIEECLKKNE